MTHGRICRSEMKMNLEKDELMDESKLIDCICVDEMNGLSPCHFFFSSIEYYSNKFISLSIGAIVPSSFFCLASSIIDWLALF